MNWVVRLLVVLVMVAGAFASPVKAATAVLQQGYDANVSNANLAETTLNTSNVGVNTFGHLFNLAVDDLVYAQPLYVPHVTIPGLGTHNVVYVATMSDSVYAFDADTGGAPLWSVNLAMLFSTTAAPWGQFRMNMPPTTDNLGILSTPVIDPSTHIMYVVACTVENGNMAYRLHAIDITTGTEPYGPGELIQASYAGVTFNADYQTQRVSLAISGNQVIFGFAAMENEASGNYVGWVMAYNKLTLRQSGAFATITVGKGGGGVWQSGRPPAVDSAGYVYLFVGNAWGGGYDGVNNFSESVLKFSVANGLKLVDWFTPSNWALLDTQDHDLTSSGPLLIPGTALLAGGGKTGDLYVLNTASLGKLVANDAQVVQKLNITGGQPIRGGPAYWNRSAANGGPLLYNWGVSDVLRSYAFSGNQFSAATSATTPLPAIVPGGTVAISANASQPGSGIAWAAAIDASLGLGTGVLHAYDAGDLTHELWNSQMYATRDAFARYAKHVAPVVTNGKVYLATLSNKVSVYGLGVAPPQFSLAPTALAFGSVQVGISGTAQAVTVRNNSAVALPVKSIILAGVSAAQYSQASTCGTSLAAGASCTVNVVFSPTAVGSQPAWLNVNLGNGAGVMTTALSGTGVAASFAVAPASLVFGSVQAGGHSAAQPVSVTNTGVGPVSISGIAFTGTNAGQFSQTTTCGATLAAGATCTISVVFAPLAAGGQSATLNVSGGGATQTVAVGGTGIVPFSLSPTTLAFGNVNTGATSAALAVSVRNIGSAPLPVTGITLSGTNAAAFSQTNTCGAPVAPGSTCTVNVQFNPTASGSQGASLSITAASGTQNVTLSGTGTVQTTFTLSPATLPIGFVTANTASAALPVTVTNTGSAPLTVSGIAFSGGYPGNFSQTNTCATPVAAGATCVVNVVFTPTAAGYVFSNLNVTGAGGAGTKAISVSGTGSVPFTLAPGSMGFGSVPVGTSSAPQVATVTNTGSVPMPVPTITFTNAAAAEYSQTNTCGAPLSVGSSCRISVVFAPTASGNQPATLRVAGPGQSQIVALTGSGL